MNPIHQRVDLSIWERYLYLYMRELAYEIQDEVWPWPAQTAEALGVDTVDVQQGQLRLEQEHLIVFDFIYWCRVHGPHAFYCVYGGPLRVTKRPKPLSDEEWNDVLTRFHFRCQVCMRGIAETKLTLDHIIPLTRGGIHRPCNWWPLCTSCNSRKSNRVLEVF